MLEQPRSGRFVAWGNSFIRELTSPDEAAERICRYDEPHRVIGVPGEDGPVSLAVALGRLRGLGARGLRLVLPGRGGTLDLPGPATFDEPAVNAGEAVLTVGDVCSYGLIPQVTTYGPEGDQTSRVLWHVHRVHQASSIDALSLTDAEQELCETLREATDALARLEVARWRPEAAATLDAIRGHGRGREAHDLLAPGYPPGALRVLVLAQKVEAIMALAGRNAGEAANPGELVLRAMLLRPLARSTRRAQMAAYNAISEPSRDRS